MLSFCYFITIFHLFCYTIEPVIIPKINDKEIITMATEIITKYEWFTPTAYLDTSGRYSIGYGTRSHEWEIITYQEWKARMQAIIRQSLKKIKKDFPYANEKEYIALLSLFYNCHGWYKKVLMNWYDAWLEKWFCELPWFSGLTKRRNEEKYLLWFNIE